MKIGKTLSGTKNNGTERRMTLMTPRFDVSDSSGRLRLRFSTFPFPSTGIGQLGGTGPSGLSVNLGEMSIFCVPGVLFRRTGSDRSTIGQLGGKESLNAIHMVKWSLALLLLQQYLLLLLNREKNNNTRFRLDLNQS